MNFNITEVKICIGYILISLLVLIWNLIILLAFCCIVPFDSINSNLPNQSISVVQSLKGGAIDKYLDNFNKNFHRILRKGFSD